MISVSEALEKILNSATLLDPIELPVEKALGYVLVDPVIADRPIPPFNRVAMDGFACRSADFSGDTATFSLIGKIQTGVDSDLVVNTGEAAQVMTGAPCPEGADAVVKIEDATIEENRVTLTAETMKPGLNIAPMGEDAAEGKVLIEAGTQLTTAGIAVCASVGRHKVRVYRKPTLSVMSTGTEIISPDRTPLPHQIRDCNSFTVRVMSEMQDIAANFVGIGEDDEETLSTMIKEGLKSNILILSGGVSMGEFDYVPKLLAENGVRKIFHKIRVKPGKPVWFGKTESGTYVFGLPGNPVSVQTCFRLFVEPLIRKLSGKTAPHHRFLRLELAESAKSKTTRDNYMPGRFEVINGITAIAPVAIRGSGDFSNFEKSDGIFRFPGDIKELPAGSIVEFLPWREIW